MLQTAGVPALCDQAGVWQAHLSDAIIQGWTQQDEPDNAQPDGMGGYHAVLYGSAPEDYSTDVLREKAKAFIADAVAHNQPFFLYVAPKAPHLPQTAAPRHDGMFQNIPPWRPPSRRFIRP